MLARKGSSMGSPSASGACVRPIQHTLYTGRSPWRIAATAPVSIEPAHTHIWYAGSRDDGRVNGRVTEK